MANSFERGQAIGLQAWQGGEQSAQRVAALAESQRANREAENQNRIRTRLMEDRAGQLRGQFMVEAEARRRDAANHVVAKKAYDNWLAAISVLDKSATDYIERYQDITAQYIGDIQMAPQYASAAQARLNADQQNMQNTNAAMFQLNRQQIISDMAKYGLMPDAMAIAADVKAGRYSAETGMFFAQAKIKAAKDEERRQQLAQQGQMFWATKAPELAVKEYEDTRQALRKSLDMEAKAKGAELELQRAESNRLRGAITDLQNRYPQLKGQQATGMDAAPRVKQLRQEMEYEGANAPSPGSDDGEVVFGLDEFGAMTQIGGPPPVTQPTTAAPAAAASPAAGVEPVKEQEPPAKEAAETPAAEPQVIEIGGMKLVAPGVGPRPRELGGLIGAGVKAAGPAMTLGKMAMGEAAALMQGDPRKGAETARRTLPKLQQNLGRMVQQFGTETDPYRKQELFDTIRETTRLIQTQQELVDRYP
jgi:hypothetical protein